MKGSIKKRGNTYTYTVDLGRDPATGKRVQKTKGGFRTKKEAQIALAETQTQYNQGTYVNESEISFKDFVAKWLKIYETTANVKVSTVRVREHESAVLTGHFQHAKLKDISGTMYQGCLTDLGDKYAKNTLSGIHSTGKMIFRKAVELKYIKNNPTEYAVLPRKPLTVEELENAKELPKFFEKNELAEFLRLCKEDSPYSYMIFLLLAYTGMRAGELCALKWKDIDFQEKTIKIYKTYYNPTNKTEKYRLLPPKTETSNRTIYIDDDLIKELRAHKARQSELRLKIPSWHDDFVITKVMNYPGYPETPKQIGLVMQRIVSRNNLKNLSPHGLRHTHASLLAEAGVGLEEIMERLGHKDDDITRNIYLHVTQDVKKEAPQKFSKLMRDLNVSKL